jgi:hypothetical protein
MESNARISSALELVNVEGMGSCSKPSMLLAPPEGRAASDTPARADDAGAGRLGMEGVASTGTGSFAGAIKGVSSSLKGSEICSRCDDGDVELGDRGVGDAAHTAQAALRLPCDMYRARASSMHPSMSVRVSSSVR